MAVCSLCKARRFTCVTIFGICLLCFVASARSQSQSGASRPCSLHQLGSIDLTPLPNDARMLVPVMVDGTPEKLLLGTAGGFITLNQATAEALHLRSYLSNARVLDVNGYASRRYVSVDDFAIANGNVKKLTLRLTPDPEAGINPPNDGIFDAGLGYRLDVEMDFANHKLNYFTPDHCEGHVVYWPATIVGVVSITTRQRVDDNVRHGDIGGNAALLGSTLPENLDYLMSLIESTHGIGGSDIGMKVTLDGQDFTANIDTALAYSTLNSYAARARFDVTADSPGSAPISGLVNDDSSRKAGMPGVSESVTVYGSYAFAHTFHSLAFGGVSVTNPHFMVRPDRTGEHDPDNGYLTGSHIYRLDNNVEPDISIGMDILSKLHLYFAFSEHELYVTPAVSKAVDSN